MLTIVFTKQKKTKKIYIYIDIYKKKCIIINVLSSIIE